MSKKISCNFVKLVYKQLSLFFPCNMQTFKINALLLAVAPAKPYDFNGNVGVSYKFSCIIWDDKFVFKTTKETHGLIERVPHFSSIELECVLKNSKDSNYLQVINVVPGGK